MERRSIEPQLRRRGLFLKSGTAHIHIGDVVDQLRNLPASMYQCCVTSPPYYGLRDYGTAQWEGGNIACDHLAKQPKRGNVLYTNGQGGSYASNLQAWGDRDVSTFYRAVCGKCGAKRVDHQIGMEATPDEYLTTIIKVFREVRRVLRDDGTCWINMGDAYASTVNGRSATDTKAAGNDDRTFRDKPFSTVGNGYKPKDLMLMPARMALALQADGWWIRSDIIWHKPNPMPESVNDRPTSSHEYVFLLSKNSRYFFDQEAVKEKGVIPAGTMAAKGSVERFGMFGVNARPPEYKEYDGFRNIRDVWTINTEPYSGAHFATMPTKLAELCIKAGSREGDWVLDPFGGSGTTGLVAGLHARHSTLIELKAEYVEIARKRISLENVPVIVR